MSSKKQPVLVPELVPSPLWGRSAFRMLGQRVAWQKKIRPDALASANNRCSICGALDSRLICHDKWQYDDNKCIASLIGFEIHCGLCDVVTHIGRAMGTGDPDVVLNDALNHLCKVNRCTPKTAEKILFNAMQLWEKRSEKKWSVVVAQSLVDRYPDLAPLPDFVPKPRDF